MKHLYAKGGSRGRFPRPFNLTPSHPRPAPRADLSLRSMSLHASCQVVRGGRHVSGGALAAGLRWHSLSRSHRSIVISTHRGSRSSVWKLRTTEKPSGETAAVQLTALIDGSMCIVVKFEYGVSPRRSFRQNCSSTPASRVPWLARDANLPPSSRASMRIAR